MVVDARESSISKNITSIVENIKTFKSPRNFTLCTDDREPKDILEKGHINDCIRVAVQAGLDPVEAVRAATLNPAQVYNLEKIGAIAPGYYADMVVFDNLKDFNVKKVFFKGRMVAENDKILVEIPKPNIETENKNTVTIKDFTTEDFKIKAPIEEGQINITGMEYISRGRSVTRKKVFTVNVKNGFVNLEGTELNFVAVVNRYPGNDNIALAVVENFYMNRGAVGTTYSHDSHNITIVYNNPEDAKLICKRFKENGGGVIVAENNKIVNEVLFPVAGMLSKKSAKDLSCDIEKMNSILRDYGIESDSPITRPSTLALIVIPDVKISDIGLIDVVKQQVIKQF